MSAVALAAVLLRTGVPLAEELAARAALLPACLALVLRFPFNSILHHQARPTAAARPAPRTWPQARRPPGRACARRRRSSATTLAGAGAPPRHPARLLRAWGCWRRSAGTAALCWRPSLVHPAAGQGLRAGAPALTIWLPHARPPSVRYCTLIARG